MPLRMLFRPLADKLSGSGRCSNGGVDSSIVSVTPVTAGEGVIARGTTAAELSASGEAEPRGVAKNDEEDKDRASSWSDSSRGGLLKGQLSTVLMS